MPEAIRTYCTQRFMIIKDEGIYFVLKSYGFDAKIGLTEGYDVIYKSTSFTDANMWLRDHLSKLY